MTLSGSILKAYNNLPAIPPEQPLGDLLNTLPVGNPALENPTGGIATLYVSASGSDDTGDGSQAKPFATPQMAIDSIPSTAAEGSVFYIKCGSGSFAYPNVENIPAVVTVRIVGDTSTPVISIPQGSVSFANVAGKEARWTGNVGVYSATITDGSHWIGFSAVTDPAPAIAYLATASASPSLDLVAASTSLFGIRNAFVYEYATTFVVNRPKSVNKLAFSHYRLPSNVIFVGISFEGGVTGTNILTFKGIAFQACRFLLGSSSFLFLECQECSSLGIYLAGNSSITLTDCNLSGSYLKTSVTFEGSGSSQSSGCIIYPAAVNAGSSLSFYDTDFESAGGGTALTFFGAAPFVRLQRVAVDAALSTVVNCSNSGNAVIYASQTVIGSVTGNAFVLTNGAQAIGLEAACNGNLTAGGSEIIVGGNAGQTFASLPATDLAAVSPQLCRAT